MQNTKNSSAVSLKFKFNWTSWFHQAALLRVSLCCCLQSMIPLFLTTIETFFGKQGPSSATWGSQPWIHAGRWAVRSRGAPHFDGRTLFRMLLGGRKPERKGSDGCCHTCPCSPCSCQRNQKERSKHGGWRPRAGNPTRDTMVYGPWHYRYLHPLLGLMKLYRLRFPSFFIEWNQ